MESEPESVKEHNILYNRPKRLVVITIMRGPREGPHGTEERGKWLIYIQGTDILEGTNRQKARFLYVFGDLLQCD